MTQQNTSMFFSDLNKYDDQLAVIDGNITLTYRELETECENFAASLNQPSKSLFFLFAHNRVSTLIAYLGLLRAHHVFLLVDPDISTDALQKLNEQYRPVAYINRGLADKLLANIECQSQPTDKSICSKLALLISTSGSTGEGKQVALSYENLQANADAICKYLPIKKSDRALCNLPFFYVYGLSIINSHLLSGACCVLSYVSPISRGFWDLIDEQKITSLAGVPYTYEMLLRLKVVNQPLPSIRYFTQAGGKLNADDVLKMAEYAQSQNKAFYVMYGQTEATARMAFLDADKVLSKPGSIGQAIPGGRFELRDENGNIITSPDTEGELWYFGKNVMLGYTKNIDDLENLREKTELKTGDLAYFDEDGDFTICGRKSRFVKLQGQRIGLDDVESMLAKSGIESYCCGNDKMIVIATTGNKVEYQDLRSQVSKKLKLHPSLIRVVEISELPLTATGKKDYHQIMLAAGAA